MNPTPNLQDWLQRIEALHPSEIELGLDRVRKVALRLDLNFQHSRKIVIAGTNGKGSTAAALQAILLQHGLSVATYTSPHIMSFNERIVLDGKPVEDAMLCQAFNQVEEARGDIALTYFEFTTLAALYCFSCYRPHIWILEVGLGGRLDAVNIVDGDVTVVTNIALDHQAWLGSNREAIGSEKAGIFRQGVPALCAEQDPPVSLRAAANAVGAPWLQIGKTFRIESMEGGWQWIGRTGNNPSWRVAGSSKLRLHPEAVAAAIQAAALVLDEPQAALIAHALADHNLSGRCEFLQGSLCELVLDVAHNPAAIGRLVSSLQENPCPGRTHMIFAMLEDKPVDQCAHLLEPLVDGNWCLPRLDVARAANPAALAKALGERAKLTATVEDALAEALAAARPDDRIVVTGSFHTVAAAKQLLEKRGECFE